MSDWSSDVCSSDLDPARAAAVGLEVPGQRVERRIEVQAAVLARVDQRAATGECAFLHDRVEVVAHHRHRGAGIEGIDRAAGERGLERVGVDGDVMAYLLRSEEHTSELQSLMRISYAVFCLKKKNHPNTI